MAFENTNLPFLREDCLQRFGPERGAALFERTTELYDALAAGADDLGSEAVGRHLRQKLFPAMAYYRALQASGYPGEEALALVRAETQQADERSRQENRKMGKLPCAYLFYRLGSKAHLTKNFPPEGWETHWVRCDGREIHFDFSRCLYWEVTRQYGCPELCAVFCEHDTTAFSGLLPRIRFERAGTLGQGADRCDFHFFPSR